MISYSKSISEHGAASMAAKDTENWNDKERTALALIAEFGKWQFALNDIFTSDIPFNKVDEKIEQHELQRPDVSEGDSPFGRRFVVHPGKQNHLTFYVHKATKGYNIGLKNSDI